MSVNRAALSLYLRPGLYKMNLAGKSCFYTDYKAMSYSGHFPTILNVDQRCSVRVCLLVDCCENGIAKLARGGVHVPESGHQIQMHQDK